MQNHGLFPLFYWEAITCHVIPVSLTDRLFLIIAEYLCLFPYQEASEWLVLGETA